MFMQINGKKIYYEVTGSGQAVVFCHGFGGNHAVWPAQVSYLKNNGYQAITFDAVGHGKTQGETASNIRELIDETAQLIMNLNLKSVILVGHSMGAAVVWGLLKFHPEINVVKVVTIDQTPKMLNDANWSFGMVHGEVQLTKDNFKKMLTINDKIKETLNGIDNRVWVKLSPFKKKYPFNRTKNLPLLFDHVQKDWRSLVYSIKVPMLVVSSSKSPFFPIGYTAKMKEHNKNTVVKIVSDAGHDVMAEKPDEFNTIFGDFLGIR